MRDFRGVSLHLLKDSGRRDVIWALCQAVLAESYSAFFCKIVS